MITLLVFTLDFGVHMFGSKFSVQNAMVYGL